MKIALIGYGKMGHAVEAVAKERGHEIVCTADNAEELETRAEQWQQADVAVEFSTPATAVANIKRVIDGGVAVVSGTTGWNAEYDAVCKYCNDHNGKLFTASNFSIGMNIMFTINEHLARLMAGRSEYTVSLSETHHIHKLDAPSGTAIVLQKAIREVIPEQEAPIESIREGEVAGIHTVRYESEADTLTLTHEAHSRRGLALGAVLAAEYLASIIDHGVYTMKNLLGN